MESNTLINIKSIKQAEALQALKLNGGWGAIAIGTGGGKSKIGINYSREIVFNKIDAKILIATPTKNLRDKNWQNEFEKWNCSDIYNYNVYRTCYASMHKIKGEHFDFVILDEYHNFTKRASPFFTNNIVDKCLALSANPPIDPIKVKILESLNLSVVYSVPLDEAVQLKMVSPYKVCIVEVCLNDIDKNVKAGNKEKYFYQTEKAAYNYIQKQAMEAEEQVPPNYKRIELLTKKRMHFLYSLQSKTDTAKNIINHLDKSKRILIFCGSIEQADSMCEFSYHSKSIGDLNFSLFNDGLINILSCVDSLNEGHNIDKAVDYALIIQANSNRKDLEQRIGRIIRYSEGHTGKVIVLVVKDTVDVKWVNSAIAGLDPSNIRRVSYMDLVTGKERLFID